MSSLIISISLDWVNPVTAKIVAIPFVVAVQFLLSKHWVYREYKEYE
jgi:putative flippase GtrA